MIERVNHFAETVLSLKKYDVVIMPRLLPIHERDAWENILLMQRAQADIRIGHAITVERRKRKRCEEIEELFTKVIRHSRAQHEVRNNLELLSFIPEVKTEQEQMELWLNTEDETVLEKYCESEKNLKIAIAPVGSVGVRSWAAKKYGEVFQKLSHKYKSNFFILGGEDAKQSATIIKEYVGKHAIDLTGKTTLRQAAVVIRQCDVYVGADTGLMHMASALQIPVIMLSHSFRSCPPYFGSTPTRTGPWKVRNIVIQPEEGLDGCTDYCKKKYPHCINQITVDEVEKALEELLESQISV